MPLAITAIYAAAMALLLITLGYRVVRLRRSLRVGLGDGGHRELERAIRGHGNLVEYAPMALILMAVIELNGGAAWLLHALGATLVIGRLLHAYGLSRSAGASFGRVAGIVLTWAMVICGAVAALGTALRA